MRYRREFMVLIARIILAISTLACIAISVIWALSLFLTVTFNSNPQWNHNHYWSLTADSGAILYQANHYARELTWTEEQSDNPSIPKPPPPRFTFFPRPCRGSWSLTNPFAITYSDLYYEIWEGWHQYAYEIPDVDIFIATATLPAAWIIAIAWRSRRIRHRSSRGQCVYCGYDMRATPDRCSECGRLAGDVSIQPFWRLICPNWLLQIVGVSRRSIQAIARLFHRPKSLPPAL
jgi:hypothetical protein